MPTRSWLMSSGVVVATALLAPTMAAQEQSSKSRGAWPCEGRVDPGYLQAAEATGGHVMVGTPADAPETAVDMMAALDSHPQTLFRLAGDIKPGVHEFRVPIESAVESVVFSISVQCLRTAEIARPSGAPLAGGEGVNDLSNSTQRAVIVQRPEAGVWTIRASGTGTSGVRVQARSALALADVQFAAGPSAPFTSEPSPGVENVVRIAVLGRATDLQASVVNAAFRRIASLPLAPGSIDGEYLSRYTPDTNTQGFRVLVEGKDGAGVPFQRVPAKLLFLPTR